MNDQTYEQVADRNALDPETRTRFITYMRTRWGGHERLQCETGYAEEWAWRFKRGIEYSYSDGQGQRLLEAMSREKYHAAEKQEGKDVNDG